MNIIRRALIPILYRWRGSKQLEYYNYLKKNQWNSLEENLKIQRKLLYKIMEYSFRKIPYYRNLNINFDSFKEDTIFEDIKNIPFLTKKELREQFNKLYIVHPKLKRIYPNTSGGSTGEPTKFIQDNYYSDWSAATKILFDGWAGRKIGDAEMQLWGSTRDILGQTESIKHRLANWTGNLKILNSFKMSNEDMHRYIDEINNFRPKLILAYVQSIYELSKYIKNNKLDVYSPGAIMTSAGILYQKYRELIQVVFECPIYDRYGSREVGDMACECEKHDGLHLNVFNHFIEIIDKDGNNCRLGEIGEVVVTTLRNYTMPLIRFKIGDMAILSKKKCSCGRGLPMIENLIGRITDVFKTREGRIIPAEYFIHFIGVALNKGSIKKFQVIQEKEDYIIVKLVLDDRELFIKNKKDFDEITEKIKLVMGTDAKVEYELVDDIPATQSGKYRYTISKVYH
jgi:phenylacetate-CoA ligase